MKTSVLKKTVTCIIAASALLFTACGKKADDSTASMEGGIPDKPDEAVQMIISEFAQGNGGILWSALPVSYQNDINELMQLAGSKMDKDVYNKSYALIARLADIIDQKKSFIVNSTFIKDKTAEELVQMEAAVRSITGFMKTIAASELSSTEGLSNFDGETFFGTTVSRCIGYLDAISQLSADEIKLADYANTTVSVIESDGKKARLLIAVPGQEKQEVVLTKVKDRWVPVDMKSEWKTNFEKMTASLESISSEQFEAKKAQISGAFMMIDGVLDKIASADTQEQFDESLKAATLPVISIFMMLNQISESDE